MKITIRLSILSILLLLLLVVSLAIIGINYFNLQKVFINASQSYVSQASSKVSAQTSAYLSPLRLRIKFVADLITNRNIVPENSIEFFKILQKAIAGETGIGSIKWADNNGNYYKLYQLDKEKNTFGSTTVINNGETKKIITNIYDENMSLIDSKQRSTDYDPRLRPWYESAKVAKKNIWLIYPSLYLDMRVTNWGIASSYPIYDPHNNLQGVVSIELPLATISDFVDNMKVTKNTVVFVCDDVGNLISAHLTLGTPASTSNNQLPKLSDLKIPWADKSFSLFMQQKRSVFTFDLGNKKYITAYQEIPATKGYRTWFAVIITPLQDIIAPLQKGTLVSFLFVTIVLLIGILFAIFLSSKISTPINELAHDASLICTLQLSSKKIFSYIKEIDSMADAFIKMKNALRSFQRYMPVTIVKNLISSGKVATVGGETKELSIIFTDIENFTTMSEKMSPQDLMIYLSEYFQVITKTVTENYGTIDKYLGDGVVAFWGAPLDDNNHALHACQSAIQISSALKALNEKWGTESKPKVKTRIGINTGEVVVGNVGSDERLSYTLIGDPVNLTSRLEELNKSYGTYTIAGESTYKKARHLFNFRLLDKVVVKGKQQETYVYELLGQKDQKTIDEPKYNKEFKIAFDYYEQGNWKLALDEFMRLVIKYPNDKITPMFIKRCTSLIANPPKNWSGVWTNNHQIL